jgi:hypothetical protein
MMMSIAEGQLVAEVQVYGHTDTLFGARQALNRNSAGDRGGRLRLWRRRESNVFSVVSVQERIEFSGEWITFRAAPPHAGWKLSIAAMPVRCDVQWTSSRLVAGSGHVLECGQSGAIDG